MNILIWRETCLFRFKIIFFSLFSFCCCFTFYFALGMYQYIFSRFEFNRFRMEDSIFGITIDFFLPYKHLIAASYPLHPKRVMIELLSTDLDLFFKTSRLPISWRNWKNCLPNHTFVLKEPRFLPFELRTELTFFNSLGLFLQFVWILSNPSIFSEFSTQRTKIR